MLIDPVDPELAVQQWVSLLDQHEREIAPKMQRVIARAWSRAANDVPEDKIYNELRQSIQRILEKHYPRVLRTILYWVIINEPKREERKADEFWTEAQKRANRRAVENVVKQSAAWVASQAFSQSVIIARTVVQRVAKAIERAVRKVLTQQLELSEPEGAKLVQDQLARHGKKISGPHARLIARQETAMAADKAGEEAVERHKREYGVRVLGKQWVTAGDERVRPGHRTVRSVPGEEFEGRDPQPSIPDAFVPPSVEEAVPQVQTWPKVREDGHFLLEGRVRAERPRDPEILAQGAPHLFFNCRCMLVRITNPAARLR